MKPQYERPNDVILQMLSHFTANSARILAGKLGITLDVILPFQSLPGKNYSAKTSAAVLLDKTPLLGTLNLVAFRIGEGTGSPEPQTPREKKGLAELYLPVGTFTTRTGWIHGITSLRTFVPSANPSMVVPEKTLIGGSLAENIESPPGKNYDFTYDRTKPVQNGLVHATCWDPSNILPGMTYRDRDFQVGGFLELSRTEGEALRTIKERILQL